MKLTKTKSNQLLEEVKSGNQKAINTLVKEIQFITHMYGKHQFHYYNDLTTADIAQEATIKIWKAISRDIQPDNFKAYINRAVESCFIDQLRNSRYGKETNSVKLTNEEIQLEELLEIKATTQENNVYQNLFFQEFNIALSKVEKENDQKILYYRLVENKSFEEISQITGINYNTARVNMSRGKKALQKQLMSLGYSL